MPGEVTSRTKRNNPRLLCPDGEFLVMMPIFLHSDAHFGEAVQ